MTWIKRLMRPRKASQQRYAVGALPFVPTHRHRKGGLYRLLGEGVYEADRSPVAIYDDADGTVWVRALTEFEDGRFTPLPVDQNDRRSD